MNCYICGWKPEGDYGIITLSNLCQHLAEKHKYRPDRTFEYLQLKLLDGRKRHKSKGVRQSWVKSGK